MNGVLQPAKPRPDDDESMIIYFEGDGQRRVAIVVNRQLPGPAIEVCKGDTVEVKVNNKMHASESMVNIVLPISV